jgi:hypothetical protein
MSDFQNKTVSYLGSQQTSWTNYNLSGDAHCNERYVNMDSLGQFEDTYDYFSNEWWVYDCYHLQSQLTMTSYQQVE